MNRRNSYNNDISAFPGLYQPQYNYQSMYVDPINLDLVREYNKDKQASIHSSCPLKIFFISIVQVQPPLVFQSIVYCLTHTN